MAQLSNSANTAARRRLQRQSAQSDFAVLLIDL
jgi:hypothetical protein